MKIPNTVLEALNTYARAVDEARRALTAIRVDLPNLPRDSLVRAELDRLKRIFYAMDIAEEDALDPNRLIAAIVQEPA